eukprot:2259677-Lingulodinium_polyedra.AAC.1
MAARSRRHRARCQSDRPWRWVLRLAEEPLPPGFRPPPAVRLPHRRVRSGGRPRPSAQLPPNR